MCEMTTATTVSGRKEMTVASLGRSCGNVASYVLCSLSAEWFVMNTSCVCVTQTFTEIKVSV